ncbi:MAG: hypothetical protein CR988_01630 [Treponema sp.]|nr:MAG: hypothetical protein CR988_01630 [Treponema sp.]
MPEDKSKIEGMYYGVIPTSKTKSITYAVEFKTNKSARLLIFQENKPNPKIFHGKWLTTKDDIIILYFENHIPASEFFKKRDNGNLSILQRNKQPFKGALYDYMVLEKIAESELP